MMAQGPSRRLYLVVVCPRPAGELPPVKRCQCFHGALVDGAPSKVGTQQGVENKNRDQFRTNGISNHGSLTLVDIHNV